jgi:hypothetical protein
MRKLLHSSTKCKLCFRNGVLDFRNGSFISWDKCDDVETCIMIQHDYVPTDSSMVRQKIFTTLFGDQIERALTTFSRALAGHREDKVWGFIIGNRDCGKSALCDAFKNAIGDYYKTWRVQNIMYHAKKGANMDESSRKEYWLLDHEFSRISISQETPDIKMGMMINSSSIKHIASGGDTITAKRNYDTHDQHFEMDMTPFIMGNSSIKCDSDDAYSTCQEFTSAFSYKKTQAEIDAEPIQIQHLYMIGDPHIKEWIETPECINGLITLMVESYRDKPFPILRDRDTTDEPSLIELLLSKYEFNVTGEVLSDDVFKEFTDKKKVKIQLESMGAEYKQMKTTTHKWYNKRCFFNMRERVDETPELI